MKRLRGLQETDLGTGTKPASPEPRRTGLAGPLLSPVDRFLNSPGSDDPLHLTNRTTGQKIRLAVFLILPLAGVMGVIWLAGTGYFDSDSRRPAPAKPLTNAEIAAKELPNLSKDIVLPTNQELQVIDVVVKGGRITGTVRNTTTHVVQDATIDFDLTDSHGSRVGGVTCSLRHIAPNSMTAFQNTVPQANANYALVREIRTQ